MLGDLANWTMEWLLKGGYIALGLLVAIEKVFPPIPSEVILPLAGFLTGQGKMSYLLAVLASTIGSLAGAWVYYEIGRRLSEERVRRFFQKHGKWLLMNECDYDRANEWFRRHGGAAVMLGRCVPGIRSLVSLPAGIQHMPITKFTVYTTIGSIVFNAILIGLGWMLGHNWQKASDYTAWFETAVWVIIAAAIAYWIYKKKFKPDTHNDDCSNAA